MGRRAARLPPASSSSAVLCSARQRPATAAGRKGRELGPPLPGDCAGDPPQGFWRGRPSVRGWGVGLGGAFFQRASKAPAIRVSLKIRSIPKDARYTTCQVRGGGVPGRRPRRAGVAPSPFSPQGCRGRRRGEHSGGRQVGGKAAAEGLQVRRADGCGTRRRRRGAYRLRWGAGRTKHNRSTSLGAGNTGGCSLGARQIPRSPLLAVFIRTREQVRRRRRRRRRRADGGGGGDGGGSGTCLHPGQRQRGAPPTARLGQPSCARRTGGMAERACAWAAWVRVVGRTGSCGQEGEWFGGRAATRRERAPALGAAGRAQCSRIPGASAAGPPTRMCWRAAGFPIRAPAFSPN